MTNKLRGKRKILLVAVLAMALCVAAGCARANAGDDKKEESKTTTAQAVKMTVANTLTADGEVVSSLEESLQPHTGYYLKKVKVQAGQAVKEGQTILTYKNGKKMKAPYDLVVESLSLPDKGDQITSDHSVTVAGTDSLAMEISVAEDQVAKVKAGDKAIVTVSAVDKTFEGEVTSVSEVGTYSDSGSTFTAKVIFDNDGSVKVGMSGSASITLETAEDVVAVPVNAVSQKRDRKVVTVQKDGDQTEEVEVETGVENDAFVEIKSGLSEGDTVIVPVSEDSDSSGFPGGGFPGGGFPGGSGSSGGSGSGGPPAGFDGSNGPPSGSPGGSGGKGGSGSGGPPSAPSGN